MITAQVTKLPELLRELARRHRIVLNGSSDNNGSMAMDMLLPVGRAVMNPETLSHLWKSVPYDHAIESPLELRGVADSHRLAGVPIAYDGGLPFGTVELHLKF